MSASATATVRFTRAQCDALFEFILVNDKIDLDTTLPAPGGCRFDGALLAACYALSRQLWCEDTDRGKLVRVANAACVHGAVAPRAQLEFKNQRARFKHLRFACALFRSDHRYPPALHHLAAAMGSLQDAARNRWRMTARRRALWLRCLLTRPLYALSTRAVSRFVATTSDSFHDYCTREARTVELALRQDATSRKAFHALRKIVSRQAAFYCDLEVLAPSAERTLLRRYLATLNGLMGSAHDELVATRGAGTSDRVAIPPAIRERLGAWVRWCREGA